MKNKHLPRSLLFLPQDQFFTSRAAFLKELGFAVNTYACPAQGQGIIHLKEDPQSFLRKRIHTMEASLSADPLGKAGVYLLIYTGLFCGRRLIEWPATPEEASKILHLLSGRRHRLYTIMALLGRPKYRIEMTVVKIKRFELAEETALLKAFPLYPCHSLFQSKIEAIMGPPGNLQGVPFLQMAHFLKGAGLLA